MLEENDSFKNFFVFNVFYLEELVILMIFDGYKGI